VLEGTRAAEVVINDPPNELTDGARVARPRDAGNSSAAAR
jgi:hypothetical protein